MAKEPCLALKVFGMGLDEILMICSLGYLVTWLFCRPLVTLASSIIFLSFLEAKLSAADAELNTIVSLELASTIPWPDT